jgi:CHASE2 domain-containing sensor protein
VQRVQVDPVWTVERRTRFPLQHRAWSADTGTMATRPASEPASLVAGIALLCALTLGIGWLVLRGGSFEAAIPAMGALTVAFVTLLVQRPRAPR